MYTSTQLPYQPPYPGQPQPSFYNPQPGPVFPGGSPYATGGGRPMLLVDMFSQPSQGGMPSPMGLPQENGASSAPESGGSGWKKFAVGATILGGLGALAYSKSWWPFNSETDEGGHEEHTGEADGADTEQFERRGAESEDSDALGVEAARQRQKLEAERVQEERQRKLEAEREQIERERQAKHDDELLPDSVLTRKESRELNERLTEAYDAVDQALDAHLQKLKAKANAETIRAAEDRVRETSEGLQRVQHFKDKKWIMEHREAAIAKKKESIKVEKIKSDPIFIEQLKAAYDEVNRTLDLAKETDNKAGQIEDAFRALDGARSYQGTTGWSQPNRERDLVPLLKAYRTENARGYQAIRDLIFDTTRTEVEKD